MTDVTATRDKVFAIEQQMLAMPQIELKHIDHFSKGVYARELHIPAGTALTGRVHLFENLNILSKGVMSVMTESGVQRVEAPFTIVSPPGTKRVAYAHTDCVWTTVHGTDETDVDKIEEMFTTNSEVEYLAFVDTLKLKGN